MSNSQKFKSPYPNGSIIFFFAIIPMDKVESTTIDNVQYT